MRKYRFREIARNERINGIITRISEWCNIHYATAVNWCSYKIDDEKSIPGDALRIIAKKLNCTIEELHTKVPTEKQEEVTF